METVHQSLSDSCLWTLISDGPIVETTTYENLDRPGRRPFPKKPQLSWTQGQMTGRSFDRQSLRLLPHCEGCPSKALPFDPRQMMIFSTHIIPASQKTGQVKMEN
jgi:hypothetical protein